MYFWRTTGYGGQNRLYNKWRFPWCFETETPRDAYSENETSLGLGNTTLLMTAAILTNVDHRVAVILRFMAQSPSTEQRFVVCLDVGDKRS